MRKKTTDQFKAEYYAKFPDSAIEIIGEYTGADNHIKCRCKICGHTWEPFATNTIRGIGCPQCAITERANKKRRTTASFLNDYKIKFPENTITFLGEYINSKKHIGCSCEKCGHEWKATPDNLMAGKGCPSCAGVIKHTIESLQAKINASHPGKELTVFGKYVTNTDFIDCHCGVCGYDWKPIPVNLYKYGCPSCAGNAKYDHGRFIDSYKTKFPESTLNIIGEFNSINEPIAYKCTKCGAEDTNTPKQLIGGTGCRVCNNIVRYDTDLFKLVYYDKFPNSKVLVEGEYTKYHSHIDCKCSVCDYEWSTPPASLLSGSGCNLCASMKLRDERKLGKTEFVKRCRQKFPGSKITMLGEYTNIKTKTLCECNTCNNTWEVAPERLWNGSDCPECFPIYSEGGGYDTTRPGILYFLHVATEGKSAYKVGITNFNVITRFSSGELKKITILKEIKYENGKEAIDTETMLKRRFKPYRYVGDPMLLSGNTELFNINIYEEVKEELGI